MINLIIYKLKLGFNNNNNIIIKNYSLYFLLRIFNSSDIIP